MNINPAGRIKKIWKSLGPGLVTGASDDDPSGIATYSQAGAAFGLATLWTALVTFPLMAAVQGMCARIGMVTTSGLTTILKKHYHKSILYTVLIISFPAIVLNIGADLEGMGAVANLLYPAIPPLAYSFAFALLLVVCLIKFPYRKIANILKILCLVLLVYAVVPFLVHQNGMELLKASFMPTFTWNKDFIAILVALLGTTISPYLFFWQASMEDEEGLSNKTVVVNKFMLKEMRFDVNVGMFFSNIVMYFIILTAGSVLFRGGIKNIDTVEQAAMAIKPLAGDSAYILFALGIIGTGLLAIPVLAGSVSYMMAETFAWKEGLDKKWHEAKGFYIILAISIIIAFLINLLGISPIKILIFTAIAYGVTAPILIAVIMHIGNNRKIMGEFTNSRLSNILGYITLVIMTAAVAGLFITM